MEAEIKTRLLPLWIGAGFLLCAAAVLLVCILLLNDGLLVYTLDDPYIHLALAQNIAHGHYGINAGEFSAPSSSILWPFIVVPFASWAFSPFLINLACSLATFAVVVSMLNRSFDLDRHRTRELYVSAVAILFILATNMLGLVFTGMEHSLQVLLVLLIAYGLIVEIEESEVRWWLPAAIVIAPLIRYECMAVSVAALSLMAMRRRFKHVLFALLSLSLCFGIFALFLLALGLDPFPASVVLKSSVVESGGSLDSIRANLADSLHDRQGIVLGLGALALFFYMLFGRVLKRKELAGAGILAASIHALAGRYDWYHRYEIYIVAFVLFIALYIFSSVVKGFSKPDGKLPGAAIGACFAAAALTVVGGWPYIRDLPTVPFAANNIYQQQYQMHRFAVDYYQGPVAVNDLGYVSYDNSNYVLDLWGLGSRKVLLRRKEDNGGDWMKESVDSEGVGLVMIYEHWFNDIPEEWVKLGQLFLGRKKVTTWDRVAFYATRRNEVSDIAAKLHQFDQSLPAGVNFAFSEGDSR